MHDPTSNADLFYRAKIKFFPAFLSFPFPRGTSFPSSEPLGLICNEHVTKKLQALGTRWWPFNRPLCRMRIQNALLRNLRTFCEPTCEPACQNTILVPRVLRFLVTGRLQIKPSGSGDENGQNTCTEN